MTAILDQPVDQDVAQQLRRVVSSLWMFAGENHDLRASDLLRLLSKDLEQIARRIEGTS